MGTVTWVCGNSRFQVVCKKIILKIFPNFKTKCLCRGLLFNKIPGIRYATLLKTKLWHKIFPVNFEKFLRTPCLWNNSGGCFRRVSEELLFSEIFFLITCSVLSIFAVRTFSNTYDWTIFEKIAQQMFDKGVQ